MPKKLKIVKPALREKKNGKIDPAPSNAYSHDEVEIVKGIKDKDVKRGFLTNTGKFVGREKAAKIAKAAGEIKKPVKKLHSHDLREGLGVKKKVLQ